MMMKTGTVKTWRERLGRGQDFPLHAPTDVERAMEAEIAELRTLAANGPAEACAYPKCNCPFDAPSDPNWCARGLVKQGKVVPNERAARNVDDIVTALYRRFKEWSKRGFGPDDVTWCEVKADVLEMIAVQEGGVA